jgi:hypothetical protein
LKRYLRISGSEFSIGRQSDFTRKARALLVLVLAALPLAFGPKK